MIANSKTTLTYNETYNLYTLLCSGTDDRGVRHAFTINFTQEVIDKVLDSNETVVKELGEPVCLLNMHASRLGNWTFEDLYYSFRK